MRKRGSGIRKWDSSAARAALLIERLEDRVLLDALGWEPGTGQLAALPATFVQNAGQVDDPATRYVLQGRGASVYLGDNGLTFALSSTGQEQPSGAEGGEASAGGAAGTSAVSFFTMRLGNGANASSPVGTQQLPGTVSYFIGDDPDHWQSGLPTYSEITYADVYDGVDLVLWGSRANVKYEFRLDPGIDPDIIRVDCNGIDSLSIDADGNLLMAVGDKEVVDEAPFVYQDDSGQLIQIDAEFSIIDADTWTIDVTGEYDPTLPLVLDPGIVWSGYLGGADYEEARAIAVDGAGNVYVTGFTDSLDFPVPNGFDTSPGGRDAFVTKIAADGSTILWSSYLGGMGNDYGNDITVDGDGNVYVTGSTDWSDFPTPNGFDTSFSGPQDAFVTRIAADGSAITWSSYLGGSGIETGYGIAVDGSGNVYLAGETTSSDFPTDNGFDTSLGGSKDGYVTKVSADGSAITWSSYLGGSADDNAKGIVLDGTGNAYVTGSTTSSDMPNATGFDGSQNGGSDAYVAEINADGSAVAWSSYLGGGGNDYGEDIAIDGSGDLYLTGRTSSSDFPSGGGFSGYVGGEDAFVSKVSGDGSTLAWSGCLGGTGNDRGFGIDVDGSGNAYVTGDTQSGDFPTSGGFDTTLGGSRDAFVTKVDAGGSSLAWSSYLGGDGEDYGQGIAVIAGGEAAVTGYTWSDDFPAYFGFEDNYAGTCDGYVTQLSTLETQPPVVDTDLQTASDTGVSDTDNYTADNTPTYDVTVNQAGVIEIDYDGDGGADDNLAVHSGGTYQFTPTLPDGDYAVEVAFTDVAENVATDSDPTIIDTAGPTVGSMRPDGVVDSEADQMIIEFNEGLWQATAEDAANYTLLASGGDAVFGNGNDVDLSDGMVDFTYSDGGGAGPFQVTIDVSPLLTDETYQLTIEGDTSVEDLAGNPLNDGADEACYFTIDAQAPSVDIDLQSASDFGASRTDNLTCDNTPTFDITVNEPGVIEIDYDGDTEADYTVVVSAGGMHTHTPAPVLPDGDYPFDVIFTDTASNVAVDSDPTTIETFGPRVDSLTPEGIVASMLSHIDIEFSEALWQETAEDARVYTLLASGGDAIFGNGNDVELADSILDFTYSNGGGTGPFQVTIDVSGALIDDAYRLTIEGEVLSVEDVAGNHLNDGVDEVRWFTINAETPSVDIDLQASSDTGVSDTDNLTAASLPVFDVMVNEAGRIQIDYDGDSLIDITRAYPGPGTYHLGLGQAGAFRAQARYAAGRDGIVGADFDNDGDVDLATANGVYYEVSVLLGNGDGTFQTEVDYAAGAGPGGIFAADFDNDGNADMVTANRWSDDVSVLLGNGDGTFQPQITHAVGDFPLGVFSADFDNDGNADLAVANDDSANVSVLLGNGDGTFQPQVTYDAQAGSKAVCGADFDNDGNADLATANCWSNDVSVLFGNGDGTFQPQVLYDVGDGPWSIFNADFDNDGNADLATANRDTADVSVLLGNGDGTFQPHAAYTVGYSACTVFSADFDNDGNPDLVTASVSFDNVSVLLGNGDGTFQPQATYGAGAAPQGVFSADLDSDGDADVVTADASSGVSALLNNGDGTFHAYASYAVGSEPISVIGTDLDGDGNADLATANRLDDSVSVLLGSASGDGTFQPRVTYAVGDAPRTILTADFDNNGNADLATANVGWNDVSVLLGNGDGTFQAQVVHVVGDGPRDLFSADFDNDGNADLVTANEGSDNVSVLLGNGDGTFQSQLLLMPPVFSQTASSALILTMTIMPT